MPTLPLSLVLEWNSRLAGRPFAEITQRDFKSFRRLGFSHVWFMGVWRIGPEAVRVSRLHARDFHGSPYAIAEYDFNPTLGGEDQFRAMRERARSEETGIIVDFVPNHTSIDAPLLDERPDFFIRADLGQRADSQTGYFAHRNGLRIAHGRDPYFPPWDDTAQLDYTNRDLREHMIGVLEYIADLADGVRCDMAMLVLRQQIRRQWYPNASAEWFNKAMPGEFWREAIHRVRRKHPSFQFIAEVYWGYETYLRQLGFDCVYNKTIYDRLRSHDWAGAAHFLGTTSIDLLSHSLHFIENHDEERAEHVFGAELHREAAALTLAMPGVALVHQGQMEGRRARVPVQCLQPRITEHDNPDLMAFYRKLLRITGDPWFRTSLFVPVDTGTPGLICFLRGRRHRWVLTAVDFRRGDALRDHGCIIHLPAQFSESRSRFTVRDLWTGHAHRGLERIDGALAVPLDPNRSPTVYFLELQGSHQ